MNARLFLAPLFLLTVTSFGADKADDKPKIPAEPIAKKKELLFSDDFDRKELGKAWQQVVPTFTVEDGALKGTQTRVNAPAADGKPAVVGHQAVAGTDVPTKDSIVELRFRFAGATALSAEFDDRKYEGSHYGHICTARMTATSITLTDQRDGVMKNEIYAMKGPENKAERDKLLKGRSATFPLALETEKWHTLILETVGDEMRATVDGQPAAYLKSSGIGHPTKSKMEFGCQGKDGYFDDIKIYNAEPAK